MIVSNTVRLDEIPSTPTYLLSGLISGAEECKSYGKLSQTIIHCQNKGTTKISHLHIVATYLIIVTIIRLFTKFTACDYIRFTE